MLKEKKKKKQVGEDSILEHWQTKEEKGESEYLRCVGREWEEKGKGGRDQKRWNYRQVASKLGKKKDERKKRQGWIR